MIRYYPVLNDPDIEMHPHSSFSYGKKRLNRSFAIMYFMLNQTVAKK